jgi:hypothetical protein
VRFNVAGNAANGDSQNTGDFIYTRVYTVDPAAGPPPPVGVSTLPFTLVDRGGLSIITDGSGPQNLGYSRIQPNAGSTTPSGVAIFSLRQNGIVVTEAGVPASPLLTSARMYAEVNNTVNTGVAFANPNNQPAVVNFVFTDETGADFGNGTLTLNANEQRPSFLDQPPFNVLANRSSFRGTFNITSNVPVSVIALRGLYNERVPAEFLITTLPVTNLSAPAPTGTVYLPHFADGAGWTTQIALVNPTDSAISGTVQFIGSTGTAATVTAAGQTGSTFNYNIPGRSSFRLATAGTAGTATIPLVGQVRVTPGTGATPSALVVFSFKQGGVTVSEAGVPGVQGSAFRLFAEQTATGGVGAILTGLAIANTGATPANVNLELTNVEGTSVGPAASIAVPANGQVATFLHQAFPGLALPFKGILRITGGSSTLSVVGLRGRYNERLPVSEFLITTLPVQNESGVPSAAEQLFPHLVNGGGYTTQFILFSGTAGQASAGNLKFLKQDGAAFDLIVN